MKKLLAILTVVVMMAGSASAAIFQDGFDYASGDLGGNTAPTGQTWNAKPGFADFDLQVSDGYGTTSGKGAGEGHFNVDILVRLVPNPRRVDFAVVTAVAVDQGIAAIGQFSQ